MEQDQLRRIAEAYLCPLFSGARLAGAAPSTPQEQLVARPDPRSLAFKVHKSDRYRLVLRRGEKFGPTAERIVKSFVDVMREIEPALSTPYERDVLRTLQTKVIARAIGGDMHESMLATIDWLEGWADRHYEGVSVTGALGFDVARGRRQSHTRGAGFARIRRRAQQRRRHPGLGRCTRASRGAPIAGHAGRAVLVGALLPGRSCRLGRRRAGGARAHRERRDPHLQGRPVAVREAFGRLALSDAQVDHHAHARPQLPRRAPSDPRELSRRLVRPPGRLHRCRDGRLRRGVGEGRHAGGPPQRPRFAQSQGASIS